MHALLALHLSLPRRQQAADALHQAEAAELARAAAEVRGDDAHKHMHVLEAAVEDLEVSMLLCVTMLQYFPKS